MTYLFLDNRFYQYTPNGLRKRKQQKIKAIYSNNTILYDIPLDLIVWYFIILYKQCYPYGTIKLHGLLKIDQHSCSITHFKQICGQ